MTQLKQGCVSTAKGRVVTPGMMRTTVPSTRPETAVIERIYLRDPMLADVHEADVAGRDIYLHQVGVQHTVQYIEKGVVGALMVGEIARRIFDDLNAGEFTIRQRAMPVSLRCRVSGTPSRRDPCMSIIVFLNPPQRE